MPAPKKFRIRKFTNAKNPLVSKNSKNIKKYLTVEIAPGHASELIQGAKKLYTNMYATKTHLVWRENGKWFMRRRTI